MVCMEMMASEMLLNRSIDPSQFKHLLGLKLMHPVFGKRAFVFVVLDIT